MRGTTSASTRERRSSRGTSPPPPTFRSRCIRFFAIFGRSTFRPVPNLTRALTRAEAALPREPGWVISGVVLGAREVDPVVRCAVWVAWARGRKGERVEAEGFIPEPALMHLADKLRPLPIGERVEGQGNPEQALGDLANMLKPLRGD
jgi:hypothetical protein